MTYSQSLDGVRAIAVLAVVLLHYSWFSAGWVGVQIFFVLSGFLITSILLGETERPLAAYLTRFYWRRTLRIFPLYYGFLATFGLAWLAGAGPVGFDREWPYLATYTYNFRGLFAPEPPSRLFFIFWSLSAEEQFYLLWPTFIFFLPRRFLGWSLLALIASAPVLRWVMMGALVQSGHEVVQSAVFVNRITFCQLDGFAIGAALALFRDRLPGRELRVFLCASAALLLLGQLNAVFVTGWPTLDTSLGYPSYMVPGHQYVWGYSALYLWAASLVLVAIRPNLLSSALAFKPLTYIGRISYGVYVYHLVVLRGVNWALGPRHGAENAVKFMTYVAVLVTVSTLSYRWFELPFLRLKDLFGGPSAERKGAVIA